MRCRRPVGGARKEGKSNSSVAPANGTAAQRGESPSLLFDRRLHAGRRQSDQCRRIRPRGGSTTAGLLFLIGVSSSPFANSFKATSSPHFLPSSSCFTAFLTARSSLHLHTRDSEISHRISMDGCRFAFGLSFARSHRFPRLGPLAA